MVAMRANRGCCMITSARCREIVAEIESGAYDRVTFFGDPKFKDMSDEKPKEIPAAEQAAKLIPKVIPVDQEGKPLCEVEAVPLAVKTPELAIDIQWADWMISANID